MTGMQKVDLALRGLMEAGIVAALAYWGVHLGTSVVMKLLLGILTPVFGFGLWGLVDFHNLGALAEPLRLIEELAISGVAAFMLYTTGQHALAIVLALLSIFQHSLVYSLGDRLLKI
jgi:hypothetical protein